MPKGYVISRVDITNPDAYARYATAAAKAIAEHGGKPLARGGRSEAVEGKCASAQRRARVRKLRFGAPLFSFRAISGGAGVARRRCGNRNGASRGSVTHA